VSSLFDHSTTLPVVVLVSAGNAGTGAGAGILVGRRAARCASKQMRGSARENFDGAAVR
jgi:hypothetical protein